MSADLLEDVEDVLGTSVGLAMSASGHAVLSLQDANENLIDFQLTPDDVGLRDAERIEGALRTWREQVARIRPVIEEPVVPPPTTEESEQYGVWFHGDAAHKSGWVYDDEGDTHQTVLFKTREAAEASLRWTPGTLYEVRPYRPDFSLTLRPSTSAPPQRPESPGGG